MKFGLFGGARTKRGLGDVVDSHGYQDYINYIVEADRLGYHSLFMVEHHFTGQGQVSAAMTLLAYLAAKTEKIRLGTGVVVLPWHNPVLVAEQAATLDLLSGGRFDFGVGKGYRQGEFDGFCMDIAQSTEIFDEAMSIIRRAWTEEGRWSHNGKRWQLKDVVVEPEPLTRPHPPLWMAAGSEGTIRRAAREGYSVLFDQLASVKQIIERTAIFREECEKVGRPYNPMMVGVTRALQLFHTEEERAAAIATRKRVVSVIGDLAKGERPKSIEEDDAPLLGTPAEIIARLRLLKAGGVENILMADPSGSVENLRAFKREVMVAFEPNLQAAAAE